MDLFFRQSQVLLRSYAKDLPDPDFRQNRFTYALNIVDLAR